MNPSPKPEILPSATPLWAALAAGALLAFWIANSAARLEDSRYRDAWHHYEYLAEGFLRGHTYLSVEPDPALLRLKDPYDPESNAHYRLWDASLYRGKFYLYFGPTPALFMLPWRIVTGQPLPQRLEVAAFAAAALLGLALLLRGVRMRHFPGLSQTALGAILVVAFHVSWLPVTLRRPAVWELPIVASVAFLWWSVYFLWRFHDSGGRARWSVAAGAALAFLMGSRVTTVFAAGAITLLFLVPTSGSGGNRRWRAALWAGALAFAGGVGLLLYNYERFGSWLEFGQGYQLWGEDHWGEQIRGLKPDFFSLRYFIFDARTYLLSRPQVGPYFPFLHPFWTDDRPAGHQGFDEIYGALVMMPVHLAGFAACSWAWRNRASRGSRAALLTLAAAVCASLFAGLILFTWAGICSRYTTELIAGWTVATSIGLMSVYGSETRLRPGRGVRIATAAAACWSVAGVWLASADFEGCMARANPRVYSALAHALDYPSQWWARKNGVRFGPVDISVRIPNSPDWQGTVLVASGRPQRVNRLVANRADLGHVQLVLLENNRKVLETPALAVTDGLLRFHLDAPWLYPPAAHPYWDAMDPGVARELQTLFSIQWESGGVHTQSTHSVDPTAFEPLVNVRSAENPDSPYVESMNLTVSGK